MNQPQSQTQRPRIVINLTNGIVNHVNTTYTKSLGELREVTPARIVLRQDMISIGCMDITPHAAEYIYKEWKNKFSKDEVILQEGN